MRCRVVRCHCCGNEPDDHATAYRYCAACRVGCRLIAVDTLSRGTSCPFLRERAASKQRPPIEPKREPVVAREGLLSTGLPGSTDFWWRGRARRNVPGG